MRTVLIFAGGFASGIVVVASVALFWVYSVMSRLN